MTDIPFSPATFGTTRGAAFDRPLIVTTLVLIAVGLVLSLAATPTITQRLDAGGAFALSIRHALFAAAGLGVIGAVAFFTPLMVRRSAFIVLIGAFVLTLMALAFAPERNGAARWLDMGPISIQPSEFLKPALVVFWAWMLAEQMRRPGFPGRTLSAATFALAAALLLMQPDVGQSALLFAIMAVMLTLSGLSARMLAALAGVTMIGPLAAYWTFPHVRARIDAFLGEPGYQVSRALEAIAAGGLFGRGPGEGVIKRQLPDAHADFVYAVAAEEFGLLASIGLIALYVAFAWRGLSRASRLIDPFSQLATAGLTALICAQAAVHIAVNTSLAPAKGMTLPFVSYGGSSMLGAALSVGFILALTRTRPGAYLYPERAS
ncbi:MAG: cell division protein FtsW [Alphaproteobacteria bacterium]|nr:cell division protein FtsW [Alphaproteobacteria bacterium]